MRKSMAKATVVAVATVGLATIGTGAATAAGNGEDYSQHVRTCQKTMGFDGVHNPGRMHHGFAGWDLSHEC